jgi:hypothetical protein
MFITTLLFWSSLNIASSAANLHTPTTASVGSLPASLKTALHIDDSPTPACGQEHTFLASGPAGLCARLARCCDLNGGGGACCDNFDRICLGGSAT